MSEPGPVPVPLLEPRDGVPTVVDHPGGLRAAADALAAGSGPVAVDAERASGYRYGQRAYLVQLRRAGAGTVLVDPEACPDLSGLGEALAGVEWVLHAASQDLPCLAAVGMAPTALFDTELAGRLLGEPRVGLGPLVEHVLGLTLEKGHGHVDWSTRPLPAPWLRYAALDVEVLVELRDALALRLEAAGKRAWADEEFAAVVAAPPPAPRIDPWRRTSGVHRLRDRRRLAVARSVWEERERLAAQRDLAPGRVLPDAAVIEVATALPRTLPELLALPAYRGRLGRRDGTRWLAAVLAGLAVPDADLPTAGARYDGPPPARAWADRDPPAAARLVAGRAAVAALAEEHGLPTENLLAPDALRRLVWDPPHPATVDAVAARLRATGAREWQVRLTADALAAALRPV